MLGSGIDSPSTCSKASSTLDDEDILSVDLPSDEDLLAEDIELEELPMEDDISLEDLPIDEDLPMEDTLLDELELPVDVFDEDRDEEPVRRTSKS